MLRTLTLAYRWIKSNTKSTLYEVLKISCNLSNSILKVKTKIVVSESVIDPRKRVADWEPQLLATTLVTGEDRTTYHQSGEKIQIKIPSTVYLMCIAFTPS